MQKIEKYANLQNELPKLQKVLTDAIQSDVLEIKKVDKTCAKYMAACEHIADLQKAEYVIYSKYIKKSEHKYEKFAFVDSEGEVVCHVSGQDMALYGLLSPCTNLSFSEDYVAEHTI